MSKPLAEKLSLKPGLRTYWMGMPDDVDEVLREALAQTTFAEDNLDWVHLFSNVYAELEAFLHFIQPKLRMNGCIWVSWYKKTAQLPTELDYSRIQTLGLRMGLVDVKVCAVSDEWSAVKFMYRRKDRS